MRKILFLTVAFALVGTSVASAQVYDKTWGVKAGVSVADVSTDVSDVFDTSNQTGLAAGAFINNYWGILGGQLELNYIEKGAKFDDGFETTSTDIKYLQPAALLKAGLPLGIVRVGVLGGVGLDIKLSCSTDGSDCDDVKSTDFTGILGADAAFYLGSISLWADGRYNFGLSNINDASDVVGDFKNRAWTFQGGIGFPLGK